MEAVKTQSGISSQAYTLAVSLGDSLGAGTEVGGIVGATLAWETGAVYKHVAKWLLKNTRKPVDVLTQCKFLKC